MGILAVLLLSDRRVGLAPGRGGGEPRLSEKVRLISRRFLRFQVAPIARLLCKRRRARRASRRRGSPRRGARLVRPRAGRNGPASAQALASRRGRIAPLRSGASFPAARRPDPPPLSRIYR